MLHQNLNKNSVRKILRTKETILALKMLLDIEDVIRLLT